MRYSKWLQNKVVLLLYLPEITRFYFFEIDFIKFAKLVLLTDFLITGFFL